ncbi:MAG TPA: polyprenyl synthetase family protein [Segeticoccus sp.]|uniref:polyprenyl synthetase family protein n=1 Tax=Segeticoccus sp. TaxID=2706531 RepID=UPI002D7F9EFB|nr:polyprenyl synthetase family protein [Segeticoccus sp.]HET8600284.1 polyprenyl synthetase family protein [Segeticoccus sp.]
MTPPDPSSDTVGTAVDLDRVRARVQAALDAELAAQRRVLAEIGDDVMPLIDAVASLVRGGKRLRALFLHLGYLSAGGADSDALVRAACAMEMFQAAALIHDDVMDDSDTRRGMPAAHRRLAHQHDRSGWAGDPDRFGVAGAILAGDLCLTWADRLYATSGLSAAELERGREWFDRMRTQLMGGQFLDVLESARGWADLSTGERIDSARRVIRFKSAKYTIEYPLLIGAHAAGLGEEGLASLSAYGLALGEAFQLRDDVLGVFGDPQVTGKPAGDDLREGKRTVLVAHAVAGADEQAAKEFAAGFGRPDLDEGGVDRLRAVIVDSGALARTEQLISEQAATARAALAEDSLAAAGRRGLEALVGLCTDRTT